MTGLNAALISAHRANLRRYCSLLATELTELEREYIHRRISETRLQLDHLESGSAQELQPSVTDGLALSAA